MSPSDVREEIVRRLEKDLVGPDAIDEVIGKMRKSRPSDFYLTGILWPIGKRIDESEDDGGEDDSEEGDAQATPGLVGQQKPCSMGLSFATQSERTHVVDIRVKFAAYVPERIRNKETDKEELHWRRETFDIALNGEEIPIDNFREVKLERSGLEADLRMHIRGRRTPGGLIATVTLMNCSRPEPDRVEMERVTLFQTAIEITPGKGTRLVPRPGNPAAVDGETRLARLLFRNCLEFAAGHQCSVGWSAKDGVAARIWTTWLPAVSVPAFREDGHVCFAKVVSEGLFDADLLGKADLADLGKRLSAVADAYEDWIKVCETQIPTIPADMHATADENLKRCRDVLSRIRCNIDRILADGVLRESFQLAMQAMALQFSWRQALEAKASEGRDKGIAGLRWRPFQLAFVLLASVSVCDADAPDRQILDLLWFPTGGGKTEAYLALVAMLAFHRRISGKNASAGMGNAAVMRYTLRLLTAQQFERATSLILSCELIRRELRSAKGKRHLGDGPFSIGLWVGGDATPNDYKTASANRGGRGSPTAEQIENCPCCGSRIRWEYDDAAERVSPFCESDECEVGPRFGLWPVFTVDSDLYRERPTLVIGTVDKFALLPRKAEMGRLFGFRSEAATDLIIQDELHLISGPLGTMAGLYETAFDWLLMKNGKRPKVIGSTATIRRAEDQVRALFDRDTCQFPPPGLDHDDSGFAVRDPGRAGRLYVGMTTAGRSAKFALQGAAASLLQSGGPAISTKPEERDGYATLLCYFNSLRELGGAIVQMLDDVPDSIKLFSARRNEAERPVRQPRELTSRAGQKEIISTLNELKRTAAENDYLDVVLATNMVSVGVDVSRLGLMLVNGQPKTRSEYIQSTSRVGRKDFPGLVVCVLNAAKARDRSHYETFLGWHEALYRDVEATSVTPFASRARDRALHAVLASMVRHGGQGAAGKPDLSAVTDDNLEAIVSEIERRVKAIDRKEVKATIGELDNRLEDWEERAPKHYLNDYKEKESLLQSAERYVRRRAAGMLSGSAWPVMNNMRSVEPSTRVRMAEVLRPRRSLAGDGNPEGGAPTGQAPSQGEARAPRRWRSRNG